MSAAVQYKKALSGLGFRLSAQGPVLRAPRWLPAVHKRYAATDARSWSTPLAKTIADAIETTGPISLSRYMRQCLTSPEGYYASRTASRDPFGSTGDFVTSPEISQVFGELVGIWLVAQWISQGRRNSGVDLIEVGPGKGTLMDDILRSIRNFKDLYSSIQGVHLVEASEELRKQQKSILCGDDAAMTRTQSGWSSIAKFNQIPVFWYEDIGFVPRAPGRTPFIVAHEFFDALPIQAFQSVEAPSKPQTTIEGLHGPIQLPQSPKSTQQGPQWRELMVVHRKPSAITTTSSRPALNPKLGMSPEFELTLSKASTPSSLVLPESSARYKALRKRPGSIVEISSDAHRHAVDFAERIGGPMSSSSKTTAAGPTGGQKNTPAGAALIIDYGTMETVPTSTLRGIKSHKLVSPFSSPGEVDLSADVDFTAIAEAALDASEGVEVHGPMEQGEWLQRMGIKERAEALGSKAANDAEGQETARKIQQSVQRLVERGGGGMGKLYKVMAIVPESGGKRPVGFGGEIDV